MKNLDRSKYKVRVSNRKEAKQFKQALLAIEEGICHNYWDDDHTYSHSQTDLIYSVGNSVADDEYTGWICYIDDKKRKEITFKELIAMIATDSVSAKNAHTEIPGLLDGKCQIEINNSREFILTNEHFKAKGFSYEKISSGWHFPMYMCYQKSMHFSTTSVCDYKIVLFADFAKKVGIKVPVFVAKSEDNVDLFEDSPVQTVRLRGKLWEMASSYTTVKSGEGWNTNPDCNGDNRKLFSTREAAEKWIEEKNKPSHINLSFPNSTVTVGKDIIQVDFKPVGTLGIRLNITGEQFDKIQAAKKSLQ